MGSAERQRRPADGDVLEGSGSRWRVDGRDRRDVDVDVKIVWDVAIVEIPHIIAMLQKFFADPQMTGWGDQPEVRRPQCWGPVYLRVLCSYSR